MYDAAGSYFALSVGIERNYGGVMHVINWADKRTYESVPNSERYLNCHSS
jgi:hypothetical protein